jgi:predicted nucleotidyltransferase component of viral defense system
VKRECKKTHWGVVSSSLGDALVTDGVASLIKFIDHFHGKHSVLRQCCRIIDGVRLPLSFRIFIERSESRVGMSPLHFIHNSLGQNIVVRQFIRGNTFEIRYVEDRLVSHMRHDRVRST